jgi:hypothetical protein
MCSNIDHLEWDHDVYWRCVLRQCAVTLITLHDTLMSIGGGTTSMCSNIDHLEWHLDVYWGCVLRQCAAPLITLNDTFMSIGGVYYVNVQQHWSPWMTSWCLLEVCTTSMCSNIDHLEWDRDFYWRCVLRQCAETLTSMCRNTDHLEWYIDVYWRCVLRPCAATLITLNDILMSTGGCEYAPASRHQYVIQGDQCCCTLT